MSTVVKDLGAVSAYAYAVEKGYTGTEAEFAELMADYAEVGQRAEDAADSALESKTAAQTAATTATNKATEATTAATTATNKAAEAQADADAAALDASQALSAASTATTKATEATTAAATATSAATTATTAKDDAVSAKTAAQTAQTGAETAAASVSASAEQIATNTDDIAQLMSEFADMQSDGVVPSAEQILSDKGVTDCVPYHYRKTGGDGADRLYDQIVGGTVCFNQLAQIRETRAVYGMTFTNNGDGTATLNGEANNSGNVAITTTISLNTSHKYYLMSVSANTIITGGASYQFSYAVTSGESYNIKLYAQLIDLTAMFGTEIADYIYQLEQTTAGAGVAFFRSLFQNDYYPYNAGELVSVSGLSEHKMVGFNQWDEEWESGSYSNNSGAKVSDTNCFRNKNTIPVIPGATYYFRNSSNFICRFYFYDASGSYIRALSVNANSTFVIPDNAYFINFRSDSVSTYTEGSICINLHWDGERDGEYEPYKAHSYPLDSTLTLRGIPKLSDGKMYYDGDRYLPDGKVERRYGVVDLGTLNWGYSATNTVFYVNFAEGAADGKCICAKYENRTTASASNDKSIMIGKTGWYVGNLTVRDSAYTDATAFKTALSGVMLVYELATPTTEEAEPYQHLQQCDPNGTEEFVSTGIVPVGHETRYPENLRAKIDGLPWDFSSLIAPTEKTTTASRNYTAGSLLIMGNVLYKVTANIANGGTITPNTNVTATTLSEILSALAQ